MIKQLSLCIYNRPCQASNTIEIVEYKDISHPDTVCDALAEELSQAYTRYCLEQFGLVMLHNVDKALL